MNGENAARWLSEQLPAMEATLAELVLENSFTEHVEGGNRVGAQLRELYKLPGLQLERVQSARFAEHHVWTSQGNAALAPIALIGHLDTVFAPGTFDGYRRDGDLRRGPGVLDMKGGLVVVAYALRALAETVGIDALPPIRLVIVADEEVGSPEGQGIIKRVVADARAALVFEAGRKQDAIITRRKGTGALKVKAHGVAAHAGNNHKEGANAIWAMARFIDQAQALTNYDRGVTVNVGRIQGGQTKNTVPDYVEVDVDVRFCTEQDANALLQAIDAIAAANTVQGTRFEIEGGIARFPLERSATSADLMAAYGVAAKASELGCGEAGLIGGGSDASTSSSMGIASIDGLGPRGIGFHTKDEQIEVITLKLKAQALARFLASFGI